jgi:acetyl-CoA carboxylase biotin carboxylase subunit
MFKKILIANRGEIALRIARTCRELGIKTVAIYSEIDRKAPFVYFADEAYALAGKTSLESYLDINKILEICKKCGAQAVHPGYGFLAENAQFARKLEENDITFIGPPADAIELMGNKTAARKLMLSADVPVVPGTQSAITSSSHALKIANQIGFPILVKASAGGGGKGMRLVTKKSDFDSAVAAAQREAGSAFGNSDVYIEKYLEEPRHIEFQILADTNDNVIHLGERECSIQRRHQKIIEEAPSCLLDNNLRRKMGQAAIHAAKACNYRNAGTIEFLVDKHRNFYFLEMNTRLQVEHPVTEMVSGLDLVQEQLLIAAGESMTYKNSLEEFWGHAIECRIYAENSNDNFSPSPGLIHHISPPGGPGIREDCGVTMGNEISLFYDPMISKLCSWAANRPQAIKRMIRALSEYELHGIHSTIPFLIKALQHPRFINCNFTTNFISEESSLFESDTQKREIAALSAVILQQEEKDKKKLQISSQNGQTAWKTIKRRKILNRR